MCRQQLVDIDILAGWYWLSANFRYLLSLHHYTSSDRRWGHHWKFFARGSWNVASRPMA